MRVVAITLLIVVVLLLGASYAFTCDSGDLTTECILSSSHTFNETQTIIGNSLSIEAPLSCNACSLLITMAASVSISAGVTSSDVQITAQTVTVAAGGFVSMGQFGSFNLFATSATISGVISGSYLSFSVNNTLDVYSNISADGYGYGPAMGPGAGLSADRNYAGSGAGYGDVGDDSGDGAYEGGPAYGTSILPFDLGSGGGNGNGGDYVGGSGGGVVNITAGFLYLYAGATISANGLNGQQPLGRLQQYGAGGGSGGSINIIAYQVNITQTSGGIHADGGNGGQGSNQACGGAGCGGRIWMNVTVPIPYRYPYDAVTSYAGIDCNAYYSYYVGGTLDIACLPGYGASEYACEACDTGMYWVWNASSVIYNSPTCKSCPSGTYNNQTGATAIDACIACPQGRYSYSGSESCSYCSAGTYNNRTGQSSCPDCPPGYISGAGNPNCTACSPGTYAFYSGSTYCSACTAGSISSAGAKQCSFCVGGSRSVNNTCQACPAGTYGYTGTSNLCYDCNYGYWSPANSTSCSRCDDGYIVNDDASACLPCPLGSYTTNGYSCYNCSVGKFANTTGSSQCYTCPINTYAPLVGASLCLLCPKDMYSLIGSTQCRKCKQLSSDGVTCLNFDYSSDYSSPGGINWTAFSIAFPVTLTVFILLIFVCVFVGIRRCVHNQQNRRFRHPSPLYSASTSPSPSSSFTSYSAYTEHSADAAPTYPPSPTYPPAYPSASSSYPSSSSSYPSSSAPYPPTETPTYPPPKVIDEGSTPYPEPTAPPVPDEPLSDEPSSEASVNKNTCVVCLERPRDVVFLPCGHLVTCSACANTLLRGPHPVCVLCRAPIQHSNRVYM